MIVQSLCFRSFRSKPDPPSREHVVYRSSADKERNRVTYTSLKLIVCMRGEEATVTNVVVEVF